MINKAVARRYAQALFALAQDNNAMDDFQKDLNLIVNTIDENQDLKTFMENPKVLSNEKKEISLKLYSNKVAQLVLNFVCLVIDKQREEYLPEMLKQYAKYVDQAKNIIDAEVRSAVQLTDKDFIELQGKLSTVTGKNVRLKQVIDTSLLGGLVVKIGDKVIDGSVTKRLATMKNSLQELQFN